MFVSKHTIGRLKMAPPAFLGFLVDCIAAGGPTLTQNSKPLYLQAETIRARYHFGFMVTPLNQHNSALRAPRSSRNLTRGYATSNTNSAATRLNVSSSHCGSLDSGSSECLGL